MEQFKQGKDMNVTKLIRDTLMSILLNNNDINNTNEDKSTLKRVRYTQFL